MTRLVLKISVLVILALLTGCAKRSNGPREFAQVSEPPSASGIATAHGSAPVDNFVRVAFPFHDEELLQNDQRNGGLLLVPNGKSGRLPLVVFLHGLNWTGSTHVGLSPDDRVPDVSAEAARLMGIGVTRPFLLAGPSQTRAAVSSRTLWQSFDLGDFVAEVARSAPANVEIDFSSILVMGHSGAGCNPQGGLQRVARDPGRAAPVALVAIDTCMDAETAESIGAFRGLVWVHFQRAGWPRPYREFPAWLGERARRAGQGQPFFTELQPRQDDPMPHNTVLLDAFETVLPPLLPPAPKTAAL
jgi:hypothetical protein